jgi:hypothetical protein
VSDLTFIEEKLKENIGIFLIDLQVSRRINELTFNEIDGASRELARCLKGSELVPRSLLNELHVFVRILRAESKYLKEYSPLIEVMADKIDMTFDLILLGESHDDRQPGEPRII